MKFAGTGACVSADSLTISGNAAVKNLRPLLVKAEPATGKTELTRQDAKALGLAIKDGLLSTGSTRLFGISEPVGLRKKPSTSEVWDWLKLLLAEDLSAAD